MSTKKPLNSSGWIAINHLEADNYEEQPESLYEAICQNDKESIKDFNDRADRGEQIRII